MKYIVLLIPALFFMGCNHSAKNNDVSSAQQNVACPSGVGATDGDQPKLDFVTKNGTKLMVCGYSTESEFDVYSVDLKQGVRKSIVTYGALQHVKTYRQDDSLVLDELIYHNKNWIPAFRRTITCGPDQCELSSESCIFKRPLSSGDLSEIRSYQNGKNKGKYPNETVILQASDLALSGHKAAQNLFFKTEGTLKLDGATSEAFQSTKDTLLKLKNANCL